MSSPSPGRFDQGSGTLVPATDGWAIDEVVPA